MRKIRKKAWTAKIITHLVILLMCFLIIMLWIPSIRDVLFGSTEKASCERSNQLLANSRGIGFEVPMESQCPMLTIQLDNKNMDEEDIFKDLAEGMRLTWIEHLNGAKEIYDIQDHTYCTIRRLYTFKDKTKEYTGFFTYLNEVDVPQSKDSTEIPITYYQYFTGHFDDRIDTALDQFKQYDVIKTDEDFAILFFMGKDASAITKTEGAKAGAYIGTGAIVVLDAFSKFDMTFFRGIMTTAGGAAGGYMLGGRKSYWDAGVLGIPYTKGELEKNLGCTYLPAKQ